MIKFLKKLNTNLNLFKSLSKKSKNLFKFLKAKKLLSSFIIISILLIGNFSYQKLRPKSPDELYNLGQVSTKEIKQTIVASGFIKSETQIDLKFQTSGQLAWVGVKEGDSVNQWQTLASLDQQALKKTLEQGLIDYSKERNDFDEGSLETYRDSNITDTIRRILQKNQWDLNRSVLDVELQNLALKYSTIITPIAGIVTHVDVPVAGVNITAAKSIFTVADPENLIFEAEIDEADIGLISVDQSAELILDAYESEPIPVTVSSINFASSVDSSGSTVYIAKFKLLNSDQRYRLGMNGEAIITIAQKQDTLTIPSDALLESGTEPMVRVVENDQIIEQVVTVGIFSDDDVEILSGLDENQTIVVSQKTKKKK